MNKLKRRLSRVSTSFRRPPTATVPEGYLPLYVGEEMERFVVNADLLNHPLFITLLNKSAQEYGYQQKGVLRIPCHVILFRRLLKALHDGRPEEEAGSSVDDLRQVLQFQHGSDRSGREHVLDRLLLL